MIELGLRSIGRRKKPSYQKENASKIFPNLLNQIFDVAKKNQIWCTNFTYLFLSDGIKRYNCTIIDLSDHSVVACLDGNHITASVKEMDIAINDFTYGWYNHVRPHTYNGGLTPSAEKTV